MAVRKGDQEQGKLQVIEASKNMLRYTYDWEQAVNAHTVIVRANEIRVENAGDARTRLLLQKEASGYLCAMMSLIDTAHMCGVISDDRAEYWSGLANKTLVLCKAWHKKEREKLKAYLTQESAG